MVSTRKALLAVGAAACVLVSTACADGATTGEQVRKQILGDWTLASFTVRTPDGEALSHPFGADAEGKLTYTRTGGMWVLIRSADASAVL